MCPRYFLTIVTIGQHCRAKYVCKCTSRVCFTMKEAFAADIKFDRPSFRSFMRKVNFLAGRTNLAR